MADLKQDIINYAVIWAESLIAGTEDSRENAAVALLDAVNKWKEKHGHKNSSHKSSG